MSDQTSRDKAVRAAEEASSYRRRGTDYETVQMYAAEAQAWALLAVEEQLNRIAFLMERGLDR